MTKNICRLKYVIIDVDGKFIKALGRCHAHNVGRYIFDNLYSDTTTAHYRQDDGAWKMSE